MLLLLVSMFQTARKERQVADGMPIGHHVVAPGENNNISLVIPSLGYNV